MEEILKLVENLIEKHKEKIPNLGNLTKKTYEKGYRYALEDVRDEIKTMIVMQAVEHKNPNIKLDANILMLVNESECDRAAKKQMELFYRTLEWGREKEQEGLK